MDFLTFKINNYERHKFRKTNKLFFENVEDTIYLLTKKIEELENDLIELKKQHEQSLKVAFEKGYEKGVKYTDGLIKEEKFPF